MKHIFFYSICFFIITLYANCQWEKIVNGLPDEQFWSISASNDTLLLGVGYIHKLYRSTDDGITWSRSLNFNPDWGIAKIIISDSNYFIGTNGDGLYISHDYGSTWNNPKIKEEIDNDTNGYLASINDLAYEKGKLYAVGLMGSFMSSDLGESWNQLNSKNSDSLMNESYAIALKENNIYTTGSGRLRHYGNPPYPDWGAGIFKSTDSGNSWKILARCGINRSIVILENVLYTIGDNGHIVYSVTLNGENFSEAHHFTNDTNLSKLIVCGTHLYGSGSHGVLVSSDFGINWIPVNNGLGSYLITAGTMAMNKDYLFVGACTGFDDTEDCGVFRAKLSDCEIINGIVSVPFGEINEFPLSIYPNPASDNISISFPGGINQSIHIYNSLGIEIKQFEEKELFGKKSINISMEGFPSGIYYVVQDIGSLADIRCLTKSFVLIR